jgi:hypothetical protein
VIPGDIVQITDASHPWYPALLVVDEIRAWGVQAYCIIPESNMPGSKPPTSAYSRLRTGTFEKVGEALVLAK